MSMPQQAQAEPSAAPYERALVAPDVNNPQFFLTEHGFTEGKVVCERRWICSCEAFKIMDLQNPVGLRQICSYGSEVLVVQVGNHILLKHWSIYKGDNLQLLMADGQRYSHQVGIDTAKAVVYKALICTDGTNKFCRTKLMFQRSPDEARSACQISKRSNLRPLLQ